MEMGYQTGSMVGHPRTWAIRWDTHSISFETLGFRCPEKYGPKLTISKRLCCRFPLPALVFHTDKPQKDVIQHANTLRTNFESRLPFIDQVMWAMELTHHLLLIGSDQLPQAWISIEDTG